MKTHIPISIISALFFTGCESIWKGPSTKFDSTYAESLAGYSYVPIEPSSVKILCKVGSSEKECSNTVSKSSLLNALPDNSIRIATRQVSGKSTLSVAPVVSNIGIEGNSYEVIIDFVNTQTVNKKFVGLWDVDVPDTVEKLNRCYPFEKSVLGKSVLDKFEIWTLKALPAKTNLEIAESTKNQLLIAEAKKETLVDEYQLVKEQVSSSLGFGFRFIQDKDRIQEVINDKNKKDKTRIKCPTGEVKPEPFILKADAEVFNVPVYYGIGLRLKANVTVRKGEVKLSSLPAISAAVEAGDATGTMSVQTIGISGETARTSLLLLDKIDSTTIQNAIQVLATIKASIGSEDTVITPRIVGFHNTVGAGAQGINLIHSHLTDDENKLLLNPLSHAKGTISKSTSG